MEQHAVFGHHFVGFGFITASVLRITAAEVARRQHGLHTGMPQHGLGGQADLAEQAFGATTGEVEHGFGVFRKLRIADNRHGFVVFDIQQRTGGADGHVARQRAVDEVHHLLFNG